MARDACVDLDLGVSATLCLAKLRAAVAMLAIVVAEESDLHAADLEDVADMLNDTRNHRMEIANALKAKARALRGAEAPVFAVRADDDPPMDWPEAPLQATAPAMSAPESEREDAVEEPEPPAAKPDVMRKVVPPGRAPNTAQEVAAAAAAIRREAQP